jgi:hypothetical protein
MTLETGMKPGELLTEREQFTKEELLSGHSREPLSVRENDKFENAYVLMTLLHRMTNEARLELFSLFCASCGSTQPERCGCRDDRAS